MRYICLFILFFTSLLILPAPLFSQDSLKSYQAVRIEIPPAINGDTSDEAWTKAHVMSDFVQYQPIEGSLPDHRTDVRVVYDDQALYFLAIMYDSAPDSILKELGARDGNDINADYFRICLDPYFKHQDAYFFGLYASGVQFEYRVSDYTYDAVWESATRINDNGWVAEIKIPYSAIRFPKAKIQSWSFQVNRSVRRTREFVQWAKTPSKASNSQLYWGKLDGIENINAPLRLSLTPYLSGYIESAPVFDSEGATKYSNSFSYNVGADLKYGLDERFTLDMTLLPDFGQVQSDNKIKNLSYREVTYDENRPFFKEGTELFDRNDLFYSRRIGKIPSGYFSAGDNLLPGEKLKENPSTAKLLNAFKISGRTDSGLGIGLFNAITNNTYAEAEDSAGNRRRFLTEPLTNFNVLVLEQDMKNNSEIYFINTNVIRDKGYDDANVSSSGFTLSNKKNTFAFEGAGAISQIFSRDTTLGAGEYHNNLGYAYYVQARKMGGTFTYGVSRTVFDNNYYTSDLGYQTINSKISHEFYVNHNLHQPWKIFRNSYNNIYYTYATHFNTGKTVTNELNLNLFCTLLDYNSFYAGGGFTPGDYYDYFEPRVEGRFQKGIRYFYMFAGISSDYRKKLAIDMSVNASNFIEHYVSEGYNLSFRPRYRVNDKLTIRINSQYNYDPYNLGFVDIDNNDEVIYGLRIRNTYTNQLTVTYIFKNDMWVSVNARHYWSVAQYRKYLTLLQNGDLTPNYEYSQNNDFNYNAFNIDFVYSWQFAPGSNLSVVYKNAIENDETGITKAPTYDVNLKNVLRDPQSNSISIKVLYYLDYLYLKKKK
jgi:hypothetical protein